MGDSSGNHHILMMEAATNKVATVNEWRFIPNNGSTQPKLDGVMYDGSRRKLTTFW